MVQAGTQRIGSMMQKPAIHLFQAAPEKPPDLLSTHHQKCDRDSGFCIFSLPRHDQLEYILPLGHLTAEESMVKIDADAVLATVLRDGVLFGPVSV